MGVNAQLYVQVFTGQHTSQPSQKKPPRTKCPGRLST